MFCSLKNLGCESLASVYPRKALSVQRAVAVVDGSSVAHGVVEHPLLVLLDPALRHVFHAPRTACEILVLVADRDNRHGLLLLHFDWFVLPWHGIVLNCAQQRLVSRRIPHPAYGGPAFAYCIFAPVFVEVFVHVCVELVMKYEAQGACWASMRPCIVETVHNDGNRVGELHTCSETLRKKSDSLRRRGILIKFFFSIVVDTRGIFGVFSNLIFDVVSHFDI